MYNQNTINHYGEEKIKKILEKDNYIINLSSIVEDRIRFRIALENYILKYNANPHSEEEKIGIDKYKKEILNTFINDPSAYTNTILLKKENAAILFTSEELLKITQTKHKIANNAQKLYMESKKRELTNDQKELREIQFLYETMGKKTGVDEYQPDDNKTKLFTWKFGDNYEEEEMGEEDVQSVEIDYPGADDFDPNDLDTY